MALLGAVVNEIGVGVMFESCTFVLLHCTLN